jgi:hypothetical protein
MAFLQFDIAKAAVRSANGHRLNVPSRTLIPTLLLPRFDHPGGFSGAMGLSHSVVQITSCEIHECCIKISIKSKILLLC